MKTLRVWVFVSGKFQDYKATLWKWCPPTRKWQKYLKTMICCWTTRGYCWSLPSTLKLPNHESWNSRSRSFGVSFQKVLSGSEHSCRVNRFPEMQRKFCVLTWNCWRLNGALVSMNSLHPDQYLILWWLQAPSLQVYITVSAWFDHRSTNVILIIKKKKTFISDHIWAHVPEALKSQYCNTRGFTWLTGEWLDEIGLEGVLWRCCC